MSNIPTIITITDLFDLAPGADPSMNSQTINPYLRSAHKIVAGVIGIDVFVEIAKSDNEDLKLNMKMAVANRLMYDYKLFETIQRRQTQQQNTYKYELEAMLNTYLSFYFDAIDSLISELSSKADSIQSWGDSEANKMRERLLIKSTAEFSAFYGIDNSDYFYFSTIFLQQTTIDKYLVGIDVKELTEDRLRRVKSIVAKLTVAYSLRQFDVTMLPKSLRNSASDGASRQAATEQEAMYQLSNHLFNEGEADLRQLLFEINAPEAGANIQSTNNENRAEHKFFLFT